MILHYYSNKGELTVFSGYTIDENGVVTNVATGRPMAKHNANGYNIVHVRCDGARRYIRVIRALASTFLGPPPSMHHTADHIDRDSTNDTLENVRWASTREQNLNKRRPCELKSAFVIVKDGVEHTAKEWSNVFAKPDGTRYSENTIREFVQQQKYGFRYKTFPNLRGEMWKAVPGSKNKNGEWFISNKNRMKYKTRYAENVMTVDKLLKVAGYPTVGINGKTWPCHVLSMMAFRPNEYAAKLQGDIVLHKHDNKLDFNPFRLRWGSPSENSSDAHDNGKFYGTNSARRPVASYVGGELEREHESLINAVRYLRENGYSKARDGNVHRALKTGSVCYARTWKAI
ncbi:hypothetical protein ATCVCan0610SP_639L [Acanthocystis turfacea Chlorella virus Can0610SP]|nr:hypothetical protein ATCVCan0610SP_639L [Acanthocystis turfacea Chlorella virus Can0610SP]